MGARSKLSADFPKVVIDQTAETYAELMEAWPKSNVQLRRFAKDQCARGAWEPVWKRVGPRLLPAFRRAKASTSRTS